MHQVIEPAIHYWGTPVVLVSTLNEDQTTNLAPMSSAWWLVGESRLAQGDEAQYAPRKSKVAIKVAGRVLGAVAQRRYGVAEPDVKECSS